MYTKTYKRKQNALIGLFPALAADNKRAVAQRQVSHFAHMLILFANFETWKGFSFFAKPFLFETYYLLVLSMQCTFCCCQETVLL